MSEHIPVLCEQCGYDLRGAASDGLCGECGEPVAASTPERRIGSPWQRGGGPVCLVRTATLVASRPRAVWGRLRIDGRSSLGLLLANTAVAGVLFGVAADSLVAMPLFALGITALSVIEYFGLRTFGRRNRWRVTPGVAMTVVGHAAVGWVAAALLAAVGLRVGRAIGGGLPVPRPLWNLVGQSSVDWATALPVGGFLVGMMVFEVLVYTGIRRCRYANPPSATL